MSSPPKWIVFHLYSPKIGENDLHPLPPPWGPRMQTRIFRPHVRKITKLNNKINWIKQDSSIKTFVLTSLYLIILLAKNMFKEWSAEDC